VPRKPTSLAERYRAHRAIFELAQQLRCTPKEAAEHLARRKAREQWEESNRRLQAKMASPASPPEPDQPPQPWWLRD
jgi:hypothetical protein